MLKLKAVIRGYAPFINPQGKTNIKIRFRHSGEYIYFPTEFFIKKDQFDNRSGQLKDNHPNYQNWNLQLHQLILDIETKLVDLGSQRSRMSKDALINYLKGGYSGELDFYQYAEKVINNLWAAGRNGSAHTYEATLNKLRRFRPYGILDFRDINVQFLRNFEQNLRMEKISTNSIVLYIAMIRAIYNRAIDEEIIGLEYYPFRRYKIKQEATVKRSLTVEEVRRIRSTELSEELSTYRDFFMLSFYLIGINAVDLLHLKKTDFENDRIVYRRSKTKRIYSIRVYSEALEIINKYPGKKYLLSFIQKCDSFTTLVNHYLKQVAHICNISRPVSTYYARHSWATIASSLDISRDVIAHALGHGQSTMTDIYIDFDNKKVDDANRQVINAITSSS